jgi:hypothetical protein
VLRRRWRVRDAVEFLLSDKAQNISGAVLTVDAGATAQALCSMVAAQPQRSSGSRRVLRISVAPGKIQGGLETLFDANSDVILVTYAIP